MGGSGTYMDQILPGNIWDALLGANAPSASNVFATMADLAGASVNIYNTSSTIGSGRTATLTDTLNFVASVSGGISIGGVPFTTSHSLEIRAASNTRYTRILGFSVTTGLALEIRNSSNLLASFNNSGLIYLASFINHTVAIGSSTSATAKLTTTGIGATSATINQQWRNSALGTLMQLNDDGNLGVSVAPSTTERMIVRGFGTAEANAVQLWQNSTPTELMRLTGNGGLCIGVNTLIGTSDNASKLRIGDTVSANYTYSFIIDQTYAQAANNTNTSSASYMRLYKASAFNTLELKANVAAVINDGTGNINYMCGHESFIYARGNAAISGAFAYSARVQYQSGNIILLGGLDVSWQENLAGNIGNMIGVYVRTPLNVTAPIVTNTYGIYLQANTIGTNNYGIVSNAQSSNAFGTDTPNQNTLLELRSTTKSGFLLTPMTAAQASAITAANGMAVYVSDTDATFTVVGGSFYKYEAGAWVAW